MERDKQLYANHLSVSATSFSDEKPRKRGCCFWCSDSVQNYRKKCAEGKNIGTLQEVCGCLYFFISVL